VANNEGGCGSILNSHRSLNTSVGVGELNLNPPVVSS
jgi:hypothetical protein